MSFVVQVERLKTAATGADARFFSPGHLPDSLSIEVLRRAVTIRRNPTLTDRAVPPLPYRGLGRPIPRALEAWAAVERPVTQQVTPQVNPQVTGQVAPPVATPVAALIRVLNVVGASGNSERHTRLRISDRADLRDRCFPPSFAG